MSYKIILLILIFVMFIYIIVEIDNIKKKCDAGFNTVNENSDNNFKNIRTKFQADLNICVNKIRSHNSELLTQARKMLYLNAQPVINDNAYQSDTDSDKKNNIQYLSDIRAKEQNKEIAVVKEKMTRHQPAGSYYRSDESEQKIKIKSMTESQLERLRTSLNKYSKSSSVNSDGSDNDNDNDSDCDTSDKKTTKSEKSKKTEKSHKNKLSNIISVSSKHIESAHIENDLNIKSEKHENIGDENSEKKYSKHGGDTESIKTENIELENIEHENSEPENIKSENIKPENIEPENIEFEDAEPENIELENIEPENVKFEDVEPENIKQEKTQKHESDKNTIDEKSEEITFKTLKYIDDYTKQQLENIAKKLLINTSFKSKRGKLIKYRKDEIYNKIYFKLKNEK